MKIFDVYWKSDQAGPSPDNNYRTEVFLLGCLRALEGNPCSGCFNKDIWDNKSEKDYSPEEVFNNIKKHSRNKYVTFVGGEPLDQIKDLIEVTKLLKEDGYHILVFTWRKLNDMLLGKHEEEGIKIKDVRRLMRNIDILIDGEYKPELHIFDINKKNGLNNVIGSGNQVVWDLNRNVGIEANFLKKLEVSSNNRLKYTFNERWYNFNEDKK